MKVKCNVLDRQFFQYQQEYEEAALRVLRSGWYVLGNEVKQFEEEFAAYTLLLISNPLKTELGIENLLPATFKNEYSPLFV